MNIGLTWKCHICGIERPDSRISVLSYPLAKFPEATINVRYCNDNSNCFDIALEWKSKGKIPQKESEEKND